MFSTVSTADPACWLLEWWDTPFLVTTSIYTCGDEDCESIFGVTNGVHPPERYPIVRSLDDLLEGKCYTICNGLTLAIAMHRLGKMKTLKAALINLFSHHRISDMYQRVPPEWAMFYYGHQTHQTADFPSFYACMGPKFADPAVVQTLLTNPVSFSLPNSLAYPSQKVALTSHHSAMLPHINSSIYNTFKSKYVGKVDIMGVLTAVCCNRRSWKWWLNNPSILESWLSTTTNKNDIRTLRFCFLLYEHGSDNGKVVRNRLRHIWIHLIHKMCIGHMQYIVDESPLMFVKDLHDIRGSNSFRRDFFKILKGCDHPYYKHCLVPRIASRLLMIKHAFADDIYHHIKSIMIEYLKNNKDVLIA